MGFRYNNCAIVCLVACLSSGPEPLAQPEDETAQAGAGPPARPQRLGIPDGTTIQLRFAQPVRAKMPTDYCETMPQQCQYGLPPETKPGETVRLVAAADVRVSGLVVVAKGAAAQATIIRVRHALWDSTGLVLKFDWVEDVAGGRIPLRLSDRGKPEAFEVSVKSVSGGMVARRARMVREFSRGLVLPLDRNIGMLAWIPVGTRILGFVHEDFVLDEPAIREAQALLPVSTENAIITVYRTKGGAESAPFVVCDGKKIDAIGPLQYTVLELPPQKHTCQIERHKPLEILAQAGEEYFFRLHYGTLAGNWELESVSAAEGEDEVVNLKPVGTQ